MYSTIGILALLVLLIENQDILFNRNGAFDNPAWSAYRRFLLAVLVYYVTDILWGFIESCKLATALFVDTSVYFVAMAAGVLLWTQYAVIYLGKKTPFERILLGSGFAIAALVTGLVIVNVFVPILFSVDADCVYHAFKARYAVLVLQILLLLGVSIHTFASVVRSQGGQEDVRRHRTMGLFGLVMVVFLFLQLWNPYLPIYSIAYMLGTCLLRALVIGDEKEEYRRGMEEAERIAGLKRERERARVAYQEVLSTSAIYESIVEALSGDYFDLFYVDIQTDEYVEYGSRSERGQRAAEQRGTDFFGECSRNGAEVVYEEDLERVQMALTKENLIGEVRRHGTYVYYYRLLIDGVPTYVSMKATGIPGDDRHIVLGVSNVDSQVKDRMAAEQAAEDRKMYLRLSALSGNMIVVYFVDPQNNQYTEFSSTRGFEGLGIAKQGADFFRDTHENGRGLIHPEDQVLYRTQVTKENMLATIERDGVFALDYRLVSDGLPTYVQLKAAKVEEDGKPLLIVGLLDEDARMHREQEHARDLMDAQRMAAIDSLTGIKNKHAYVQWEERFNARIRKGEQEPFAVAVCDINDLKLVNDQYGHKEGDACIRRACARICGVFSHSPVFRIGGDEFVVLMSGGDYDWRVRLMEEINAIPQDRSATRFGDTIAAGMAEYQRGRHDSLLAVFEEADKAMYEQKQTLKAMGLAKGRESDVVVTPDSLSVENVRKRILIVDDVELTREILGELLCDDYDIAYASDGVEALELMRDGRNQISLVLLDLYMPNMSGREVLAEMQVDEDLMTIPVIVLTSDEGAELDCLRIGAMDFITKAYPDIEIVKARIAKCIELSESRDLIRHTERDNLTGLLNKDYFFRYASRLSQIHREASLDAVVCDVNRFHSANVEYGRQFCDQVLRCIGAGMAKLAHKTGGIACRREGDTFLLYCPHRDSCDELLGEFLADVFVDGEMADRISLRFGVCAGAAEQERDIEEQFARAKVAADRVRDDPRVLCGYYGRGE